MSDWFTVSSLAVLGLLFISGYLGGCFAHWLKFPRVSGYIVAGMLLSPSISAIIPAVFVEDQSFIITDIALAIIAYSIGGSLNLMIARTIVLPFDVSRSPTAAAAVNLLLFALSPVLSKFESPSSSLTE